MEIVFLMSVGQIFQAMRFAKFASGFWDGNFVGIKKEACPTRLFYYTLHFDAEKRYIDTYSP